PFHTHTQPSPIAPFPVLYLDEWQQLHTLWEKLLATARSQRTLQRLRSALQRLHQDWQLPIHPPAPNLWRATLRALIAEILQPHPEPLLNSLTDAAENGLLLLTIHWHLSILASPAPPPKPSTPPPIQHPQTQPQPLTHTPYA
ncbi:MAG: hypothetical protein NZM04_06360, partial [Methylacidiphilales bacterium]|nr:hypothetical protein [Candidatus Methylacidiphilales bacterium]